MADIIAQENFIFTIGGTNKRRIVFNSDTDLSAYTARMQARSAAGAADVVFTLTTGAGLTMGPNYVDINLSAATVPDLDAVTREDWVSESADECGAPSRAYGKVAVYDLKLYSDDVTPEEYIPLAGEIVFRQAVTEDA
ncbi:MAG: hypothetical protein WA154_11175 [Moraxellaceae bacterium]